MHNVLWDIHTISPVLHKLCKLVPVSRPFSQWGVWVDAITWYCHILTAEPHFNSETENTHTEYLNTSSTAIYLQKMANELRSIRTYVLESHMTPKATHMQNIFKIYYLSWQAISKLDKIWHIATFYHKVIACKFHLFCRHWILWIMLE